MTKFISNLDDDLCKENVTRECDKGEISMKSYYTIKQFAIDAIIGLVFAIILITFLANVCNFL